MIKPPNNKLQRYLNALIITIGIIILVLITGLLESDSIGCIVYIQYFTTTVFILTIIYLTLSHINNQLVKKFLK